MEFFESMKQRFDANAFRRAIRQKDAEYDHYMKQTLSFEVASENEQNISGARVMAVVAFEHPEYIELQYKKVRQYYEDTYLVFDNSVSETKQQEIRTVCERCRIPYARLPRSPFDGWAGSEAHGAALNLITNHLRDSGYGQVLFLDHDLFPFAPTSVFDRLTSQPYFGKRQDRKIDSRWMWYLWPGYLALDLKKIHTVNFRTIRGADTGSAMWPLYYRQAGDKEVAFATEDHVYREHLPGWLEGKKERIPNIDGIDTALFVEVLDDAWIHLVGGALPKNKEEKFDMIRDLLQ